MQEGINGEGQKKNLGWQRLFTKGTTATAQEKQSHRLSLLLADT